MRVRVRVRVIRVSRAIRVIRVIRVIRFIRVRVRVRVRVRALYMTKAGEAMDNSSTPSIDCALVHSSSRGYRGGGYGSGRVLWVRVGPLTMTLSLTMHPTTHNLSPLYLTTTIPNYLYLPNLTSQI